jgi:MoxR-like ATPase
MTTERALEQSAEGRYTEIVRIKDVEDFRGNDDGQILGDRRDGKLYRYTPGLKLCVNVALATGRPLLVLGPTGCGKSSLAFNLARIMHRRYYEFVVTSRSQGRDLLYRFDAVRRFGDAQFHARSPAQPGRADSSDRPDGLEDFWTSYYPYIEPGPLWWIINPASAARRGYPINSTARFKGAEDPKVWGPDPDGETGAVLLIDEVDKAEPDFPNNLLVPLGSRQFVVEEVSRTMRLDDGSGDPANRNPLVIITSNRERELPEAFVRRCVVAEIPVPRVSDLVEIARIAFGDARPGMHEEIALRLEELRGSDSLSTAEYLDAVTAIRRLDASGQAVSDILLQNSWRANPY